ncbi:hypothetical protein ELI02_32485 [Rhizobium leguminosarum]|jgi:hypothetical protein|uniref:Uncharacterized protein n=1 Tax=Rhizobium leguminosarum TaxID=384 RepID=A0A4Q8XST7_RHILE|nr:hypothetical protein ELI41_35425 [Rhizobium leguminosarum]TAU73260.1 hypothetical protein ELI40_29830 [Rhizobium leguminosarum]TAV41896.1 hypothetical protein ELI31_31915 [Rhizobium leguminosarum]TAV42364.1 hypothetical protein ELI32_33230 [Rhizobium leguminosarum]TAV42652.1 hypothetical protein ELI29_31565 [Rhizobium leguminosarum]
MSYRDPEPSGSIFPGVVILLAMAALVGTFVSIRQPAPRAQVWVPVQPVGSSTVKSAAACSPVWARCGTTDPI